MAEPGVLTAAGASPSGIAATIARLAPSRDELRRWYALMHLGRLLDDKAPNYLKQGLGWSYHAPCAGHDGIQVALGVTFRPRHDYLFPYYRDLTPWRMTWPAAGAHSVFEFPAGTLASKPIEIGDTLSIGEAQNVGG